MKHEAIEQQQEVAYGLPNTAITGKKQALMQVRLDIPSNDQYGGALWVPLYLAPPTSTAIAAMVIKQAAEIVAKHEDVTWDLAMNEILALTPQDGRTQLEEFGMNVANEIAEHYGYSLLTEKALNAIVTNLIGASK